MNTHIASGWITSKLLRVLVLAVGVFLFVIYGTMLIAVSVNLPDSWFGLVYVTVGLAGAIASFRYYRSQRRLLLIAVAAALLLTIIFLVGTILFGEKLDEYLKKGRGTAGGQRASFVSFESSWLRYDSADSYRWNVARRTMIASSVSVMVRPGVS